MRSTAWRGTKGVVGLLALVLSVSLAGCSGSGSGAYCDALRDARTEWVQAGASLANRDDAVQFVSTVRRIEATAPDEVRTDWVALERLFEKFTVDDPDLASLTEQMKGFEDSAKRIETHAKELCDVDLAG